MMNGDQQPLGPIRSQLEQRHAPQRTRFEIQTGLPLARLLLQLPGLLGAFDPRKVHPLDQQSLGRLREALPPAAGLAPEPQP